MRRRAICVAAFIGASSVLSHHASAQPTRPANAFRVLEWNVSDSGWVRQSASSRAVLRWANPDVLVLAQVSKGLNANAIKRMLSGLRGPADTTWFITIDSVNALGNVEHTVIASRDSVKQVPEFALVLFPETGALAARATIPANDSVTRARGGNESVRTNGAMVRVGSNWLFVVGVHFMCCGTIDTWREYRRQLGAIAVRDRLNKVLTRLTPNGIIIAGDMNLVSGSAPLDTVLTAAAKSPFAPMVRANALHFDNWTDWTWDGRNTPFNGGRLDNIVYSSGKLVATNARIYDTEYLPLDTLTAHELTSGTSVLINQHRPVVVDFTFKR
ncbi:MAG: endonuclease/exonuclease/phosphatase family protein [Gemmatimonadaceae bacterium]